MSPLEVFTLSMLALTLGLVAFTWRYLRRLERANRALSAELRRRSLPDRRHDA